MVCTFLNSAGKIPSEMFTTDVIGVRRTLMQIFTRKVGSGSRSQDLIGAAMILSIQRISSSDFLFWQEIVEYRYRQIKNRSALDMATCGNMARIAVILFTTNQMSWPTGRVTAFREGHDQLPTY